MIGGKVSRDIFVVQQQRKISLCQYKLQYVCAIGTAQLHHYEYVDGNANDQEVDRNQT